MVLDLAKQPGVIVRFFEMVLCAVCSGLVSDGRGRIDEWIKLEIVYGTFFGFLLVAVIVLLGYILEVPIEGKLMIWVCGGGVGMFLISGAFLLDYYVNVHEIERILVCGIMAIVCCVLYLADAICTFKGIDTF